MQTTTSKFTKKYQATVPEVVRKELKLKAGDIIAFEIDNDITQQGTASKNQLFRKIKI
ncbi:type II toxin-antitoxin system PrlF family antitoxin [Deltaproteobacteria bacterium TL4]